MAESEMNANGISQVTQQAQKVARERYFDTLTKVSHEEYAQKDPDMPDCTVCLVNYLPTDEIVVFSCDAKHYFHTACGRDWLGIKSECPLCREDFSKGISAMVEGADILAQIESAQPADAQ